MRLAVLCLLLSSCGPVLLGEEELAQDSGEPGEAGGAGPKHDATPPNDPIKTGDAGMVPRVSVRILPLDCGKCFDLHAEGSGGTPPYEFEWEDGTARAQRTVCPETTPVPYSVVARDAASARSTPHTIELRAASDAGCPAPAMPPVQPPRPLVCLKNTSLEGTPAANFGQSEGFDAEPWSACTNPETSNTPHIGNAELAQTLGTIPDPTDGNTFLALGEGAQVSQALCKPLEDDGPISLQLDLTRINIGAGVVPETEQVFLEIWAGLSVNCSRHELLWASGPLEVGWKTYCVTLRPRAFFTQLTLRANADGSLVTPVYLLVDNIKPVESCP